MKLSNLKNSVFIYLFISIIISIIGSIFYINKSIPFLDIIELKTIDLRFQTRGHIKPQNVVTLAVIDEKSIAKQGKWIWPRKKIAKLINKLSNAQAKVIAFDIGFFEKDEKNIIKTISNIEKKIRSIKAYNTEISNFIQTLKNETDYDNILANAIKNSKAKIVLGFFFQMESNKIKHITNDEIKYIKKTQKIQSMIFFNQLKISMIFPYW